MDALMLDGNAVAGLLREVFAVEMTTALGTCGGCGATEEVASVHVYQGAGVVMRCPYCDGVLVKVVTDGTRAWIASSGVRTLQVSL
jgi:hypothetical protein